MGKLDQDLKEIIDVIAGGIRTAKSQLANGFQYTDIFAFVPILSQIPTAISGNENAWKYLLDMNEEKENDLVNAVVEQLGDSSETIKVIARRLIRTLAEMYMLILAVKDAADSAKTEG